MSKGELAKTHPKIRAGEKTFHPPVKVCAKEDLMVQWMWLMSCLYCSYTDPFLVHVFPHIALLCKEVRICSIAHEQIVVGATLD